MSTIYCPRCGAPNTIDSAFCASCGASLEVPTATTPSPTTTPPLPPPTAPSPPLPITLATYEQPSLLSDGEPNLNKIEASLHRLLAGKTIYRTFSSMGTNSCKK